MNHKVILEDFSIKFYFHNADYLSLEKAEVLFRKTFSEMIVLTLLSIGVLTLAFNILYVKAGSPYLSITYSQQVGGHISEDTTWTMEGGPYIIVEDVIVESDVTLTVEPGVVVKFTSGTNLIVNGALVAEGNTTHAITFTSNSETPSPGDWGSIKFRDSIDDDLCKISYGVIEYGTTAVSIEYSATSLLSCDISNNAENGISDSEGSPTISGCSVSNNQRGILIEGADASATVIDNNIVNNALEGILLKGVRARSGPTNISENTISFNGRNGITCDVSYDVFILGNIISKNTDYGISSNRLDMHIKNNMIKGNDHGIYVEDSHHDHGQKYPISYNYIYENALYDFRNLRKDDLDAPYNWWGTSNETAIQEHIYDHYDDHDVGEVIYTPYLVPPVANFTFSPETPYAYEGVTFDASTSFNPHGSIINYTWNFDDGNITTTTPPVIMHMYTTPDDYNVTLTVTDEFGLTDSTSAIVAVLEDDTPPTTSDDYDGAWHTADFTITLTATDDESGVSETYYRINDGPTIESVSTNGQPLISLESTNNTLEYWSVDNVDNEEFPHKILTEIKLDKTNPIGSIIINNDDTYTNTTSVTLILTATDDTSGVYQVRCSNDGVWDTEPWEVASQTKSWTLTSGEGTKTVYYQIKDTAGLISTYSDTIILDTTPPTGSILIAEDLTYTNSISVTLTLIADDTTSGVAQMRFSNDNVTWTLWEAYSTSKAWTLTTDDGIKTVYVQYRDNAGLISSSHQDTIILDTTKPIANAGPDQNVYEGTLVTFDGSASADNVGIAGYTWTFTDVTPQTLNGKNPAYTFSALGIYAVILKVADPAGNYAADIVIITVVDITKPIANAGPDQNVYEGTLVTFDGSASADNVGIAGYTWTFTDVTAKTLTGEKPAYTFTTPGVYTVTLNVTDADGNWAIDTVVVTVMDITSPIANAGADQKVGEDTSVTFDASGSSDNVGIVSYEWDFGDGTIGTEKKPSHTFTAIGDYTVTLTVKDAAGNIGTDTVTVTVMLDTDGDGTPDVIDTDDDDDGMPDTWETENGLNPLDAADGSLDPDGDGLTNLQEHQRGTNPKISDAEALTTEAFALWVLGAAVAMIALAGALAFLWMRRK
jgi:PKD repeat protein